MLKRSLVLNGTDLYEMQRFVGLAVVAFRRMPGGVTREPPAALRDWLTRGVPPARYPDRGLTQQRRDRHRELQVTIDDGLVRLDTTPADPRRYQVTVGGRPVGSGKGCSVDIT